MVAVEAVLFGISTGVDDSAEPGPGRPEAPGSDRGRASSVLAERAWSTSPGQPGRMS